LGSQVQRPENIQAVLDLLGITDQLPFELLPVVLPVVSFERPSPSRDIRGAIGRNSISGAASEYGQVELFNPVDSGVLVQPEIALVQRGDAGEIGLRFYDTPLTSANTSKTWRDRRIPGTPIGLLLKESNAARLGTLFGSLYASAANISLEMPFGGDFVLGEGQGIVLVPEQVQKSISVTWFWTEVKSG